MSKTLATSVLLLVASQGIIACGAETSRTGTAQDGNRAAIGDGDVTRAPAIVDRFKYYESLSELASDSDIVVVGVPGSDLRMNPYYGDETGPFAILNFTPETVLKGRVPAGSTIEISVEAGMTPDGGVEADKLTSGTTYALFLVPQGERSPHTYVITGYMAGIYKETSDDQFTKVDSESPLLPERTTVPEIRAAVG